MDIYNLIAMWTGWPVVVAIILVAGSYASWLLKNRIDFAKEQNEQLNLRIAEFEKMTANKTQDAFQTLIKDPDVFGIKTIRPKLNERVGNSFDVDGVFQKRPPADYEIWVFVFWENGKDIYYWPQEPATIRGNAWYSRVNHIGSGTQKILVFLVGKNGQALMKYFKRAGMENSEDKPRWPGIIELPEDIIQCTSVEVVVN
ncbi:MAG: hypothetical protein WA821_23195 [Anaerolineales bacterium]